MDGLKYTDVIFNIMMNDNNIGENFYKVFDGIRYDFKQFKDYDLFVEKLCSGNVKYDENIDNSIKSNFNYVKTCLMRDMNTISLLNKISFTEDEYKVLADIIKDNNYVYEKFPITNIYAFNSSMISIYESILKNNIQLIDSLDYESHYFFHLLEECNYKFNPNSSIDINACPDYFLRELENDFNIINYFNYKNIPIEVDKKIYSIYSGKNDSSELTDNMLTNPYIYRDAILSGKIEYDPNKVCSVNNISYVYSEISNYLLKNGKKDLIDVDNFGYLSNEITINNDLLVVISDYGSIVETLNKAALIMSKWSSHDLTIEMPLDNYHLSSVIRDNSNFFNDLLNRGFNVHFKGEKNKIISLEDIMKTEKFLNQCARDVESKNLSNFEKFIAVYDIVKNLRAYKEEPIDESKKESRNIYRIFSSEYIVCVGYAEILMDLLNRVDIKCAKNGVITNEHHARVFVNIEDDKYGINGYYITDPTWDAIQLEDSGKDKEEVTRYKHLIFTNEEQPIIDSAYSSCESQSFNNYENVNTEMIKKDKETFHTLDDKLYSKINNDDTDLVDYFKDKINQSIPVKKIVDAIIEVKKKTYKNISDINLLKLRINYAKQLNDGKEYADKLEKAYKDAKYFEVKDMNITDYLNEEELYDEIVIRLSIKERLNDLNNEIEVVTNRQNTKIFSLTIPKDENEEYVDEETIKPLDEKYNTKLETNYFFYSLYKKMNSDEFKEMTVDETVDYLANMTNDYSGAINKYNSTGSYI